MLAPSVAQALSMVLHELATNAIKYGSLSSRAGFVAVAWTLGESAKRLHLTWTERYGPPLAAAPSRRGFGSRLIDTSIQLQLHGTVQRRWEASGLVCEIDIPLIEVPQPDLVPVPERKSVEG